MTRSLPGTNHYFHVDVATHTHSPSESCIKGHRSSSCNHTDRTLLEVRKKGRPVSQCHKCRQLRNMNKKHSKCTCNTNFYDIDGSQSQQPQASTSGTKRAWLAGSELLGCSQWFSAARFVPIAPAPPVNSRPRSCSCGNPQNCTCLSRSPIRPLSTPTNQKGKEPSSTKNGLATLARAAAMLSASSDQQYLSANTRVADRAISLPKAVNDRIKVTPLLKSTLDHPPMQGAFPIMPPMARVLNFSGSGCTCGPQCTCVGCPEHRGPENVPNGRGYTCGDCVDHSGGIELPLTSHAGGASRSSVVDQFFARGGPLPFLPQNQSIRHDVGDQMHRSVAINSDGERVQSLSPTLDRRGSAPTGSDGECSCDQAHNECRVHGKQGDSSQEREPTVPKIPIADDRDVRAMRPLGRCSGCDHKSPS
jgi:hypothetical protein